MPTMRKILQLFKPFFNKFGYVLLTQEQYKKKLNAEFTKGYQERILEEQTKQ